MEEIFPEDKLRQSNVKLKTYSNEPMKVTGTLNVKVQYEDEFKKLVLVVTAGNVPSSLGRNRLNHIKLNWKNLFALRRMVDFESVVVTRSQLIRCCQ